MVVSDAHHTESNVPLIIIGISAGILAGLFGVGGGVIIVPGLIFMLGMTPQRAAGTSLAAMLLPVGALGVWQYYKSDALDLRAALIIGAGMFLGVWVGAYFSVRLPPRELQRGFALFLLVVAGRLWWTAK